MLCMCLYVCSHRMSSRSFMRIDFGDIHCACPGHKILVGHGVVGHIITHLVTAVLRNVMRGRIGHSSTVNGGGCRCCIAVVTGDKGYGNSVYCQLQCSFHNFLFKRCALLHGCVGIPV